MWHRLLYFFVIICNFYIAEGQTQVFIGQGTSNLYFTLRTTLEWDWGLNYCHTFRLMPGSIETEEDHQIITNFLNTSTIIEDDRRFLWLPATDHRREGTFQWMWNMKEVNVGSWAPGMPSMNRSANCLAINRFGQFMEESCHSSGRAYYTLCAAENFQYESRNVSDIIDFKNASIGNHEAIINNDLIHQKQLASLRYIGQVGNVMYFADDEMISWAESLDLCHAAGMRLASPEQPDQFNFIQEFAAQQDMPYHLGGTDRLSVSCAKSNTEYRWFYSGNRVANQTNFLQNHWWYLCTCLSPSPTQGIFGTNCAKGGSAYARTVCEISIQS